MTTPTRILTDERLAQMHCEISDPFELSRAIEAAVLQSPEVQALRKDAERYRYLSSMATQQADTIGPIFRIDVRRTPKTLFNFDAAIDHARRIEGEGK